MSERRPFRPCTARAFAVGDELLVYSSADGTVVSLSPTASAVWDSCDGESTVREIAERIADEVGAESSQLEEQILRDVVLSVTGFAERGIVAFAGQTPSDTAASNEGESTVQIGFDSHVATIRSDRGDFLAAAARRLSFLRREGSGVPVGTFSISAIPEGCCVRNVVTGMEQYGSLEECLHTFEHSFVEALVETRLDLTWLHAGAAAKEGRALLLVGASGSGKSTLVTGLCSRGWSYLSDETAPIDCAGLRVFPFPTRPLVRESGREVPPEELYTLARSEFELDPRRVQSDPVDLAGIVFPAFSPGAVEALTPCSPSEAGLVLIRNCHSFRFLGETAVERVAKIVDAVPAFRLSYSDPNVAADLLAKAEGLV